MRPRAPRHRTRGRAQRAAGLARGRGRRPRQPVRAGRVGPHDAGGGRVGAGRAALVRAAALRARGGATGRGRPLPARRTASRPISPRSTATSPPRPRAGWRCSPSCTTPRPGQSVLPGFGSPPRDPAAFARFMTAVVGRYGPDGSFWGEHPWVRRMPVRAWQIWNEPNIEVFWSQQPFAPEYAALLRAGAAAVHDADPGATVVLAGLTNASWVDLAAVYDAGARGSFDVVAVHPYTHRARDVLRVVRLARREMRRNGDGALPIWLTELSWPAVGGLPVEKYGFEVATEAQQAQRLRLALRLIAARRTRLKIGRVFWYTWLSTEQGRDSFDWSGLRRTRGGRARRDARPRRVPAHRPAAPGLREGAPRRPALQVGRHLHWAFVVARRRSHPAAAPPARRAGLRRRAPRAAGLAGRGRRRAAARRPRRRVGSHGRRRRGVRPHRGALEPAPAGGGRAAGLHRARPARRRGREPRAGRAAGRAGDARLGGGRRHRRHRPPTRRRSARS